MSIGVHRDLVYVANAGPGSSAGDTNYTGFRLDRGGQLRAIRNSTYVLPNGSQPGQVLFNRDGTKLAGTRVATSEIDSFTVGHGGRLTPAPGSPYDAQAFSPPTTSFPISGFGARCATSAARLPATSTLPSRIRRAASTA